MPFEMRPLPASFVNTKQNQIFLNSLFGKETIVCSSVHGKTLYSMLCVIVVPGNPIVVQKSKELRLVISESLLVFSHNLRCRLTEYKFTKESLHFHLMFSQFCLLQAMHVDSADYCFKQLTKAFNEFLILLIKRVS